MAINRQAAIGIFLITFAGVLWGAMGTAVQFLFKVSPGFNPLDMVALRQICAGGIFVLAAMCVRPKQMLSVFHDFRLFIDVVIGGILISRRTTAFWRNFLFQRGDGRCLSNARTLDGSSVVVVYQTPANRTA